MWMKPCSSLRISFGMCCDVRVSPNRKIGMSALRRRVSRMNLRRSWMAWLSGPSSVISSSSIETMKDDARAAWLATIETS
jgi:hypothetical protein